MERNLINEEIAQMRKKMGLNSKKMAFNNFSKGSFVQAYQKILND